jgi:hypothetical protein
MAFPHQTCHHSVAVIGPRFGTASQAIETAIRDHVGDENVQCLWYEESEFERKVGRLIGRLIRVVSQVLPLSNGLRSQLELFVGLIRFQRSAAAAQQLAWAQSCQTVDNLLLVKPMFLRQSDLLKLWESLEAKSVNIFLWDALWRTPSINNLVGNVHVFSTEPTDCQAHGFTFLQVPRATQLLNDSEGSPSRSKVAQPVQTNDPWHASKPVRLFFCGSWSLDRWLSARKMMSAIRQLEKGSSSPRFVSEIHLVTTNRVAGWFTRTSGFKTTPVDQRAYEQLVAQCDVLLDLGRLGQSSPSERVAAAIDHGKIVLSTNPHLKSIGFPAITVESEGWEEGLQRCERAEVDQNSLKAFWNTNQASRDFAISAEDWVEQVFSNPTCTYKLGCGEQRVDANQ